MFPFRRFTSSFPLSPVATLKLSAFLCKGWSRNPPVPPDSSLLDHHVELQRPMSLLELVPQDPNDESASVLLERIRAEQETAGGTKKSTKRKRK